MIDFKQAQWMNKPNRCTVGEGFIEIVTEPGTDLWQRTYYGFRNDNAPALLISISEDFSFTTRVVFKYQTLYDQCGLVIYIDSENWFKAAIEYENPGLSRLGSVVTNFGYSDWATTDIETPMSYWYRLSRKGPDFLIESSTDGRDFMQMRIFHLHSLGETTAEGGKENPSSKAVTPIRFGPYACSPNESSFTARFTHFKIENSIWTEHIAGTT